MTVKSSDVSEMAVFSMPLLMFALFRLAGVIFFATQFQGGLGDFISLNLVKKRLQFKYYLGSGVATLQ